MKKPSDYTQKIWNSIFENFESETIFRNIMVILRETGDIWRDLSWEEYKAFREKDGGFSEKEKSYFEKVKPYSLSETLAQEVVDGIEGYVKKYKHGINKIYFYRLKGYYSGYIFKDLKSLDEIVVNATRFLTTEEVFEKYELIELPILKYQSDWIQRQRSQYTIDREATNDDYFIECGLFTYNHHWNPEHKRRFTYMSLYLLTNLQEKNFIEIRFNDWYSYFTQ